MTFKLYANCTHNAVMPDSAKSSKAHLHDGARLSAVGGHVAGQVLIRLPHARGGAVVLVQQRQPRVRRRRAYNRRRTDGTRTR